MPFILRDVGSHRATVLAHPPEERTPPLASQGPSGAGARRRAPPRGGAHHRRRRGAEPTPQSPSAVGRGARFLRWRRTVPPVAAHGSSGGGAQAVLRGVLGRRV